MATKVKPAEFPPPFDPEQYVGPPTDAPEERLEAGNFEADLGLA